MQPFFLAALTNRKAMHSSPPAKALRTTLVESRRTSSGWLSPRRHAEPAV